MSDTFVLPRKAQKKWDKLDAKINGFKAMSLPAQGNEAQAEANAKATANVAKLTEQRDAVYAKAKAQWDDADS